MDLVNVLKRSFDLLLKDVLPLVVAALIVGLLTPLTLGILGGPLVAGLYRMVLLRLREGRTPEIGDVFYFERFGSFVAAFYGLGILIVIGLFLLVVPGLYLATIWFYVFALMVDRQLGLTEAMTQSKALVDKAGLGPQFALVVVLALLGGALNRLTMGLGGLVFAPYAVICVVVAYEMLSGATADSAAPPIEG